MSAPAQGAPGGAAAAGAPSSGAAGGASAGGTTGLRGLRPVATPRTITLEEAFALAVQRSWDLRVAHARIDEAKANVTKAWSAVLPNVSFGGQYSFNFPEQSFSLGSAEQFQQQALLFGSIADITAASAAGIPDATARRAALERAEELRKVARDLERSEVTTAVIQPAHVLDGQLQIQVPLFSARALPALQNAYAAVDLTRLGVQQARAAVVYGVARTYFQVVATTKIVDIARRQVESAARHRDLAQQRVDAGVLTPLALQRAELDLARAGQQARAALGGLKLAKGALASLLGVVEDFDVTVPPAVPAVEEGQLPEGLIERARATRPDLRLQKEMLAVADRARSDAWGRLAPMVALTAAGRGTTNVQGLVSQPFTGTIGVAASVPIFDGGLTMGYIDEANARIRQELLKLQQLEALIEQEVRGTVDDITLKLEAKDTADRVAALARATKENTDRLFEAGVATSLDVTDASLGAFSAEVDAERARFELESARLGLAYALGELHPADELAPMPVTADDEARARAAAEAVGAPR